jgi:cystathionine beta-lyase/cystathionine gamma-synthase
MCWPASSPLRAPAAQIWTGIKADRHDAGAVHRALRGLAAAARHAHPALRVERMSANAFKLATWLKAHPKVADVYYPGLESHPGHDIAKRGRCTGGFRLPSVLHPALDHHLLDLGNRLRRVQPFGQALAQFMMVWQR